MSNSDGPNMLNVIQVYNGTPDANSPNEAMPTTVELSLTSNQKLRYSLTTMPGSANSACHNPTVTSTDSSRNVFTHYLLTMRAILHF